MWWLFSLLSAASQAARSLVMKDLGHKLDEYVNVWGRFVFLLPFTFAVSYCVGFPEVDSRFWIVSLAAGISQVIGTLLLSKAFKYGDISISTAIWKLHVIFVLLLGVLFLRERVTPLGILGIMVSLFGVYLLNSRKAHVSLAEPILLLFKDKALRYALLAAVAVSPTILLFKRAAQLSDPFFSSFTNHVFAALILLPLVIRNSSRNLKKVPRYFGRFLLLGLFACGSTVFGNIAYVASVSSYVEAVKQVEILLALIVGFVVFNERENIKEIGAGCAIIAGGILILIFA
jgi:drug/metabolite transporter (DMT)-like permease